MAEFITVILAAGKGTRMKSKLPKVLHKAGGKPMLQHVIDAAKGAGAKRSIAVVGFQAELVREAISADTEIVVQAEQLGTGHAVLQTAEALKDETGTVMVLCGDTPLLTADMLRSFYEAHCKSGAKATVLTAVMPDSTGYGRVIRSADGMLQKIVEHKDATEMEREIREVNSGIYCFDKEALFSALSEVECHNAQGEYYLPDVLDILRSRGEKIAAYAVDDYESTLGVNSRVQLAQAEKILRDRKNNELMERGVTLMDPAATYVDTDVVVGSDTVIYPGTWLEGRSVIGSGCQIGPNCRFNDVKVGDNAVVSFTYAHECEMEEGVTVGPYVHIRPNTVLKKDVHVGNFVEIKNSNIGDGTKLPHLSYIGDCDMGSKVNMGCGTITVNYDGMMKHRTVVGDNAFIGCNTNLVAPVTVGDGAYVGAGSTITKEVPAGCLAVARAHQKNIRGWADKRSNG